MKQLLITLTLPLLIASCSSDDYDMTDQECYDKVFEMQQKYQIRIDRAISLGHYKSARNFQDRMEKNLSKYHCY